MNEWREGGRKGDCTSLCLCVCVWPTYPAEKKKKATENTKRKKESVLKSYDALVVCMYDYLDSQSVELYRGSERETDTHRSGMLGRPSEPASLSLEP